MIDIHSKIVYYKTDVGTINGGIIMNIRQVPDEILLQVEKPGRYIGNEINMVRKKKEEVDIRFAFCFPDVYEIGMSHLGMQILYHFLNQRQETYCERVFAPWVDLEEHMRKNQIPLFALESQEPIKEFDFLGFTLQYEMSYTNILNMLDLGNIPVYRQERNEEHPIVCAGGPCAYNPEPLADFIDFFYLGEGEVVLNEVLDIYLENKAQGGSKKDFLEKILLVEGIYVPEFYDVTYKETGEIATFKPTHPNAKARIQKVVVEEFSQLDYPKKPLVPLIQTVHDRVLLEVFRGCLRGCRFCQAGMVYRPVREKPVEMLLQQADDLLKATGHDEISLVSLSTSDYSQLEELINGLIEKYSSQGVNISLPSLRIDAFSLDIMEKVQDVRKSSLTFAPEAGTQRLRDVINKGLSEKEILQGSKLAFEGGWERVKLYFMMGLPTETQEDLSGIAQLGYDIVETFYTVPKEQRGRNIKVVVSTSCFVPKPFTPFQWEPQDRYEEFMDKQHFLRSSIRKRQIQYQYHDAKLSVLEGVIARGDRRVGQVIYEAWTQGCTFDGWSEYFDYDKWMLAFQNTGIDPDFYAHRKRDFDEILPWDHISIGVTKKFLQKEYEKSLVQQTTPHCRLDCEQCGAMIFRGGVCDEM